MTSNFNPKQSVPNASTFGNHPQNAAGAYSPSVPMSLYRELAAELQATKVMLDSLNNQNQHLNQQNQQLRQEIEKVVHSTLHLQQIADSFVPSGWGQTPYTHPELRMEPQPAPKRNRPANGAKPSIPAMELSTNYPDVEPPIFQEKLVMEQSGGRYRRRSQPEKNAEVNGWWLTLAIVLIVVTAFGAGYLIMRPMLMKK